MNRVIIILGLVIITGFVIPDLSRAHRHLLVLPENERQSVRPTEPGEFLGPVLKDAGLSQRAEQPSWNRLSLTHTDTHFLPGSEWHHPAAYRSFIAPDGLALMFSWPFSSVPTFQGPQVAPNEAELTQEYRETDRHPR